MIRNVTNQTKNNKVIFVEKFQFLFGFCLLIVLFLIETSAVYGQSLFNANSVLTTATNYSTGILPTSTTDVKLTTSSTSLDLSASSLSMRSLNKLNGLSYTLNYVSNSNTNRTLTLGGSNFTNSASGVTNDLIYVGAGSLNIAGSNTGGGAGVANISLASTGNFNVASGASLTIGTSSGCVISGAKYLKTGAGTLSILGANTNTGGVTLSAGTLNLNNSNALGTGQFAINGGSFDNTSGSSITLSGYSSHLWSGGFAFIGTNDLNLGTGTIYLASNSTITTQSGNLTIGGTLSGAFGGYKLTKLGAGTLTISGSNLLTGDLYLSAGLLNINSSSALGTHTFYIENGTSIDNTSGNSITNGNGRSNANSWGGNFTFIGTNNLNLGTGGVALTSNVGVTTNAGTFTVGGIISGAYSLSKLGSGTLVLSGVNSFSGGMTLTGGKLIINNSAALGTGTFSIGSLTQIDNTSGNSITNNKNNLQSWGGDFTFIGSNNYNSGTGAVTLTANTNVTTSASTFTVGGSVTGGFNLAKSGNGVLALNSANSYSGSTTVNAGTLQTGIADVIPAGSNVNLNGGTLSTGSAVGFSEGSSATPMGVLTLSSNSKIALGTGSHKLYFSDSHSTAWTGSTILTITGWTGTTGLAGVGTGGRIFIGSSSSGLTAGQLSQITFSGYIAGASITSIGEIVPKTSPTITVSGTLSGLSTTYGTASSTTSFTVSGTNLSPGVIIIPPAGFEVSQTSSSSGFAGSGISITVTATAGIVSTTTIYVRLASVAASGTYSGNIKCQSSTSSPAVTKTIATVTSTIAKKNLTVVGTLIFSPSKVYDGSTTATPTSGSASLQTAEAVGTGTSLDGVPYAGDAVSLTGVASYNYNSPNVVSATTITASGLSLTGAQSGNYSLVAPTFSATITALPVSVTPNSGQSKVYGASDPTLTYITSPSASLSGLLARAVGENVNTYSFNLGTLSGAGNYSLSLSGSNTFAVTSASLSITANNRSVAYGTSLPLGTSAFSTLGLVSGDAVSSVTLQYNSSATVPGTVPAATYSNSIIPSSATGTGLSNYNITYNNGTLTVTGVGGTWTGITNTDFGTGSNWSDGNVPGSGIAVTIPVIANQPILGGDFTIASLSFASSANIDLNGHSLTVSGSVISGSATSYFKVTNASTLSVGGGTIYFDPSFSTLGNLTVTGSTTLGNSLNITGVFTPTAGTFTTGGNLTLKSTSETATAVVGVVGGTISGSVTVERFIKQGLRTFRDLCPEVSGAGSVFTNWQESGSYNNGYGVFITGISGNSPGGVHAATGFDISSTGAGSMQTYSSGVGSGSWSYITSTKALSLSPYQGYRLLIRGNRAGSLYTTPQPASMWSDVKLRATGSLVTGAVNYTATGGSINVLNSNANAYSFIGNPYACPINWNSLTKSHLTSTYQYFDPTFVNASGNSTYVSYNTISGTSSNPGPTNVNQYIQPGEAFWVQNDASGIAPSLTINETDKVLPTVAPLTEIFGTKTINRLAFSLMKGGGKVDAAVAVFRNEFTNDIGDEDSRKLNNQGENLTLLNKGVDLSIDGTSLPKGGDTLQLHMYNLVSESSYQLNVDPSVFKGEGVGAFIYDAILKTKTPIGSSTVSIEFKTASDVSSNANRFSIVFYSLANNGAFEATSITSAPLKVSPNPILGNSFELHFGNIENGKYYVSIYNSIGVKVLEKVIYKNAISSSVILLDSKLSVGNYIIKLTSGNKNYQTLVTIAK